MINVYFDGAWITPEITGSWGFVIQNRSIWKRKKKGSGIIINKDGSCNFAEYRGLLEALKYLLKNNCQDEKIKVFGDSKLVINQVNGKWRIKNGAYVPVAKEMLPLLGRFRNISFSWIPREQNEEADDLTNKELAKVGLDPEDYFF